MTDNVEKLGTVLVVDDTPDNIDVLKGVLSDEFIVKAVTSGEKALSIAETAQPDVILLDIMMPGMDGYEVCRRLKEMETTREIPVIFVTAMSETTDEERGFELGCVDYLTKPINPALTLARVKTHTALRKARVELQEWNSNLKGRVKGLSSLVTQRAQALSSVETDTRSNREDWLDLLVQLLDMLDENLQGHATRVAALSVEVAKRVKCTPAEIETIRLAAFMHDIGKIGLPAEVSTGIPDKLPEFQKRIYQSHGVRGQFLLSHIEWLHDAGVLIRHHHEEMNGSGSPDRLIGAEIPLGARIISIADFIDRSTSHEKFGTMLHTVMKNVGNLAGRCFDKDLIAHFNETASAVFDRLVLNKEKSELIPLAELKTGVIMGEDLYSGSRILIMNRCEIVSSEKLETVKRAIKIDPPGAQKVLINRGG